MKKVIWFFGVLILLVGCGEDKPVTKTRCHQFIPNYDPTLGVDRSDPDLYLLPGVQSELAPVYVDQVKQSLGEQLPSLSLAVSIAHWVNYNFQFVNAGGANIGKYHVNFLFQNMEFYGCHSQALLISSIARAYGIPALVVETASCQWALDYLADTAQGYVGHVMSELYVDGQWILLDNSGSYVKDYQPDIPFIPTSGSALEAPAPLGLFAIAKGRDQWEYGVTKPQHTQYLMERYAENADCLEFYLGQVQYNWN